MGNLFFRALFLLLVVPVTVSAAALDDYYLSRFGENGKVARALVETSSGTGAVQAERCLTPLYHSLKHDWNKLEGTTQKVLAKVLARPYLYSEGIYPSPGGHFNIHYAKVGSDAPSLTDADSDGWPDWVEKVGAVFDHVYTVEVGQMGYRSPTSYRYDVYLRNLVPEGAYGYTSDDGAPAYPSIITTSYIEIDRAFSDSSFTVDGLFTPEQLLQITAAHEFHHAIQYAYNYYFDITYGEMTSTWMEDEVYKDVNQLYGYLSKYLPRTSYLPLNAATDDNSVYGRWIFNRYLAEAHSASLIRQIWAKIGAAGAPSTGDDLPMLPSIDSALKAAGSTLSADFLGFAKRVCLRDWATNTEDLALIPTVEPQVTYSSYPVDLTAIKSKITSLPAYTFAYYRFLVDSSAPTELSLFLSSVPAGVDVVAVKRGTDGSTSEYRLDRTTGKVVVPSFNSAATSDVLLIICNSGSDSNAVAVASGDGKGSGCFIATAAYGSYLHPKVALLRDFRDRYLLTNAPGRFFVSMYYRLSPPIANMIAEHAWMRAGVRILLTPVVVAVEYPGGAAVLVLICAGGMIRRRRSSRFILRRYKVG